MALYVGPDQVMPLASILATIMGFLLVFWNKLVGLVGKIFGPSPRKSQEKDAPPPDSSSSSGQNPQQK
jgi:hypothetical protein